MAGRAGIVGIVVIIEKDFGLFPEYNDFCSISTGIGRVRNAYSCYSLSCKVSKECTILDS